MTMEELVQQLSDIELAIGVKTASMREATKGTDQRIEEAERALDVLREHRTGVAAPYTIAIADDNRVIESLKTQIIDGWDGEKKTMRYPVGTLKFRTTQSPKINDKVLVLTGLLDRISVAAVATKYIKDFNLTAVKKYMSVLDLPMGAAEIEYKTTVKLDTI